MAITTYQDNNNNTLYKVYVNVRSDSGFRVQKRFKGIKTLTLAKRKEKELLKLCTLEIKKREEQGESFASLLDQWELYHKTYKSKDLNATTRTDYLGSLHKHCTAWLKRPAASITRMDVMEVLNQMLAQGYSQSYQNKMKVIIHRMFRFGIEHQLIKLHQSPAYGIKLQREEKKKPEILSKDQIVLLLQSAKTLNHAWYPVWAMALLTGMRNGELYALTWKDIDWENKLISVTKSYNTRRKLIKSTKSGDWRSIPISSQLEILLKELKLSCGKRKEVLPQLTGWSKGEQARILRAFCTGLGLPSVKFHTLRACFATQLIRQGIAPIQIQKICGWKDLETMQRYVRLAGIETTGVTEGLKILPCDQIMGKVISLQS